MTQSISEKVIAIIAEQAVLDVSDVTPDRTLDDLGIDSLGMVEAVFAIEEQFDITVPFNANEAGDRDFPLKDVAAVIEAVAQLIAARAG
ncbi:MAG: acyl carrier protein [Rhodobacteraceae bacterium]|nr:acyl carrier protein [Paracoccaceae bacterium]